MKVTAVESSTLATIAYDETRELLQLQFHSCALYQFFSVPPAVHEALLCAPSKGGYFNQAIRGKFQYRRVCNCQVEAPEDIPVMRRR